jgi:hypothetical protein
MAQTVAQGVNKQVAFKAQSALGTAVSGSGGQLLRRESSIFTLSRSQTENNEITSHQNSTGATAGFRAVSGTIKGLLSPLTYSLALANLLRKDFAAVSAITGMSITIAASGSDYTVTRAAGSFLSGGIKYGMVVRLTAGSFAAPNLNKNLFVVAVSALVLTVRPLNRSTMTAEGPIASATLTVPGKLSAAAVASHTDTYFGFEDWYADVSKSELWNDCQAGMATVSVPGDGNIGLGLSIAGLSRTRGTSQVLTSPTVETTTPVLNSSNGMFAVGATVTPITGMEISIDGSASQGAPEVGSNSGSDIQRGTLKVKGSFEAKFTATTIQDLFDDQSATPLAFACGGDGTAAADFVGFALGRVKVFSDADPKGDVTEVLRRYEFTAEYNGTAGGSGTAYEAGIISLHDSQAA